MKPPFRHSIARGAAEFYCRRPANRLLVQGTAEGGVIVCASADNFTPEQQDAFVRYLCAEGFMQADCEPPTCDPGGVASLERPHVRWIVDPSWPEVDPWYSRHLQRLCWYTIGFALVYFTLLARLAYP